MTDKKYLYGYSFPVLLLLILFIVGCYKDKGNYDYRKLPAAITIDTNSYQIAYQKVLNVDTLVVDPVIEYDGNESDLSYEWQMWNSNTGSFRTLQKSRKLEYKCGKDSFVNAAGSYSLRLAVINSKLPNDTAKPGTNMFFSRIIALKVVTANYIGLMVLHGDGQQCDVGLIQDNFFMPKVGQTVTTKVTPDFYSTINAGEKIPGVGRQIEKVGVISDFGGFLFGNSDVYIFTDQVNWRTSYLDLEKSGDYSSLFFNPSDASGKPGLYYQIGENQHKAMVDDGRLFHGSFLGPLFDPSFEYYASPYVALQGSSNAGRGAIVFDIMTKAFLYCSYGSNTSNIHKFPDNTVSGVNLQPNNMNADLLYMDSRGREYNTLAIMKDNVTGNKYLADFNFVATELSEVSAGRYPMEALPDQQNIRYYSFGRELNMVYYATDKSIYQYFYQGGNTANVAYTFPGDEQITMMKVIKYEYGPTSKVYQYSNKQMVVATVDSQGNGKLYAFSVNTVSGEIQLVNVFEGFGRIYDASVKDQ